MTYLKSNNKSLRPSGSRAWVEIETAALRHNYQAIRKHIGPQPKLMAVVKSNAYGHGLLDYARTVEEFGADWLGVDTIVEGLLLRREGRTAPILALGYTLPEKLEEAAAQNVSVTISNLEHLKILKQLSHAVSKLRVHVKVDTGMHRQGFLPEEIEVVLKFFKSHLQDMTIEGVYTHFAAAKNPAMRDSVEKQFAEFKKVLEVVRGHKLSVIRHACNSGATLIYPEAHLDMVRVGIALYGLWPEEATKRALQHTKNFGSKASKKGHSVSLDRVTLQPALAWKTIVGEVKRLPKGGQIGYDLTESVPPGTLIAVCPVGYWHGYFRTLSSVGDVLVRGKRAKVLGRVSMDMIVINVSGIQGVQMGDEVTLIGQDGSEMVSAEELASLAGTSNYELLTRINPFTKRIYF